MYPCIKTEHLNLNKHVLLYHCFSYKLLNMQLYLHDHNHPSTQSSGNAFMYSFLNRDFYLFLQLRITMLRLRKQSKSISEEHATLADRRTVKKGSLLGRELSVPLRLLTPIQSCGTPSQTSLTREDLVAVNETHVEKYLATDKNLSHTPDKKRKRLNETAEYSLSLLNSEFYRRDYLNNLWGVKSKEYINSLRHSDRRASDFAPQRRVSVTQFKRRASDYMRALYPVSPKATSRVSSLQSCQSLQSVKLGDPKLELCQSLQVVGGFVEVSPGSLWNIELCGIESKDTCLSDL